MQVDTELDSSIENKRSNQGELEVPGDPQSLEGNGQNCAGIVG